MLKNNKIKYIALLLCIIGLLGSTLSYGQLMELPRVKKPNIKDNVYYALFNINKNECLEYPLVGLQKESSEQYSHYLVLRNQATTDELIYLVRHSNRVIRGYASWALADRNYPYLYQILNVHLKDTSHICVREMETTEKERVACTFYYYVWEQHHKEAYSKKQEIYLKKQLKMMDESLIDAVHDIPSLTAAALTNRPPRPQDYQKIRKLALQTKLPEAITTLAQFHNPNDITVLKEFGETAFLAIQHFQHADFWAFLMDYESKLIQNQILYPSNYYDAIAAFKNKAAIQFLKEIPAKIEDEERRKMHLIRIFKTLKKSKKPIFDELLIAWWTDYGIIDKAVYTYLKASQPTFLHEIAIGLSPNMDFYHPKVLAATPEESLWVIKDMLDWLKKDNPKQLPSVFNKNLAYRKGYLLSFLISNTANYKDEFSIETLLDLLKNKSLSAYNYKLITQTILELGKPYEIQLLKEFVATDKRLEEDTFLEKDCKGILFEFENSK